MGVIYKITSPTERIYVGKTYNLSQRIDDYKCKRYNSKKSIIMDSIKKYGWNNHKIETIENIEDSLLNEREIFWISELKTYHYEHEQGMNLTKGGDGQRHSWKDDKERVAKAKLRCGENAPMYGKKLSIEAKEKLSKFWKERHKQTNYKFPKWVKELSRKKACKAVVCYNSNGEFIGEYESTVEASRYLGVNRRTAADAVNGLQTHTKNIIFRFKTDNYPLKIDVGVLNKRPDKKPVIVIFNGIVTEYPSKAECSKELGLPEWRIAESALKNNRKPTRTGHIFVYKDNYSN